MEAHEGTECVRFRRRAQWVVAQKCRKAHGVVTELGPHGGFVRCAVVPFIEEQVQRALDGREARLEVRSVRDIEQPLGRSPGPSWPA